LPLAKASDSVHLIPMSSPPEDAAQKEPETGDSEEPKPEKVSLVVPLIIASSFFMEGLDTSIINTSLPRMAEDMNATPPQMSAAITSYLLSLAIFIPISGWFADRFGYKQVYCAAIATFTLGSVLCGFSNSLQMLIVARIIQGIGGAMMTPVGRMILVRSFPKSQLMRAMTFNMLPANLGPTMGPLIGGYITETFSWKWNFFLNAPLGLLGIFLALRYFKNEKGTNPARFDWTGFVIVAAGLVALQLAVENLTQPDYDATRQATLFCAAVFLLASYVIYALRHKAPVVDLRMFRIRIFTIAVLFGNISRLSVFPISFVVALFLQVGFGYSPLEAGSVTMWFTAGALVMRANVASIVRMVGLRTMLMACAGLTALMSYGFSFFTPETPAYLISAYGFVFGMLRNAQHQSVTALAYSGIPREDVSKSTTISSLVQRCGQSFGVALAASLLAFFASGEEIAAADFEPVFIILALITASACIGYTRLKPSDGEEVSGHRIRSKEGDRG
jgi:EmrB/QacA subfamily drug resistance transporter